MQVNHVEDHITHAVLGGKGETIAMGFADDSALMEVLSTSLYTDQKLAVVREVICNAWDAHIAAGRTDTPIQITLTDTKLVIRDFGLGIAPEMMGPLYGTYGGTNKKNDGNQTGGFGLGCKSPFAYTDHFEVQSSHAGTRTIYRISKSSAAIEGKRGITPIASFPTTEEGLQVTINLATFNDEGPFRRLIKRVVKNGEISATLNGDLLETFPFSKSTHGFLITSDDPLDSNGHVFVRYGNVIYPVPENKEYRSQMLSIDHFLNRLSSGGGYWSQRTKYKLILQAQPNTISITPSREALSLKEHTIKSLKQLMAAFLPLTDTPMAKECYHAVDRGIAEAAAEKDIGAFLTIERGILGKTAKDENTAREKTMYDLPSLGRQYIRHNYPKNDDFYKRDLRLRFEALEQLGSLPRGHLTELKRLILVGTTKKEEHQKQALMKLCTRKFHHTNHVDDGTLATRWLHKRVFRPLVRDLLADPAMSPEHLYVLTRNHSNADQNGLIKPVKYQISGYGDALPMLRKVVVLSWGKLDLRDKVTKFPELEKLGKFYHLLAYVCPMRKSVIEQQREFFKSRGYTILDLTVEHSWTPPKPVRLKAERVVRPKKVGYAALSGALMARKMPRMDNCFEETAPRVQNPVAVERTFRSRAEFRELRAGAFTSSVKSIIRLFGDQVAVVLTEPQEKKLLDAGVPKLEDYVVQQTIAHVTNDPAMLVYWEHSVERILGERDGNFSGGNETLAGFLSTATMDDDVRKAFGLPGSITLRDQRFINVWREIISRSYWNNTPAAPGGLTVSQAKKFIRELPSSQLAKDLAERAKARTSLLEMLNLKGSSKLLKSTTRTPDDSKRIAEALKALLG